MELTLDEALQKAIEVHKAGQVQEADRIYTAILQAQPKHPDANHNMGVLAVSVGKIQESLVFFKTALEANPSIGQYWLSYIDALIKLDQMADAQAMFHQAKDQGANTEAFDQLELRLNALNEVSKDPPQEQLQPIVNLYIQGQLQQALSHATIMLEQFPDSFVLYNISGAANAGLGQFDAAIDSCKQALKIKPNYAKGHSNMGAALQGKGDSEAAIASYQKALKIKPDFSDAYNNMGIALKDKGDSEAAIASYQKALKIKPDYTEAYSNMGVALKDKGDLEAAIDCYKKALKIKPDYSDAYYNMGIALKLKGDLEAAIDCYKKALKIKPDYAEAYANMGIILSEKGELGAAIDSYKQAVKIKPDYAEAFNNMGVALNDKGNLEAAIDSYKNAIKIKPDYSDAHFNLGLLLLETNHYEAASEYFKFNHKNSQYYLLRCFYLQDKKSLFYDQLDYLIDQDEIHPIIGSLVCRSSIKYGVERPNLFCKDPLNYVLQTDLCKHYDFEEIVVSNARTILQEHRVLNRRQTLLTNGYQTSGNLFSLEPYLTEEIQKIINLEIDKYLIHFKDSNEGLITSWPNGYSLYGWLVNMKSGGTLRPHMHEQGWLSGSIYINVPEKSKTDSGNLVVCIEEEQLTDKHKDQEKNINVVSGSLCLFPASLLHYTIPFESEKERIVLAFDVVPKC